MTASPETRSVVIAGGALVGMSLAVALGDALGRGFSVTVVDPALAAQAKDPRASAIAAGARRMLEGIGAWDEAALEAQPIRGMTITDSRLDDPARPSLLGFDGDVAEGEAYGHMVENRRLAAALKARADALGIECLDDGVKFFREDGAGLLIRLASGRTLAAPLLVAADGANSRLRELSGIATVGWSYDQAGIVTTVAHERDHEGRAVEHFLPAGPFARLPLKGNRSSIVWTESEEAARRIVALPDDLFHAELERRFGLELGEITVLAKPRAFPLRLMAARSFRGPRLALAGDAAHVIHPIAGQGVNMGFRDVAALAEAVVDAARLGLDIGAADVLAEYERRRRFDTMTMGLTTDILNRLFGARAELLRPVRDLGLGIVERLPRLKSFFIREAAGIVGEVPRLMRGEHL